MGGVGCGGHPGQSWILTAIVKVWRVEKERKSSSFVEATMHLAYSFSKSRQEVFYVFMEWGTFQTGYPIMVHGRDFCIIT